MGGDGPDPVLAARARWSAAEARLYPQVMTDPQAYERTVRAVGAVVAAMRERTQSRESLVALEAQPGELLHAVSEQRATVPDVSDQLLIAAGCAMRDRELPDAPAP